MKKEIINRIIERLNDCEDVKAYACDLGYTLFEAENSDGTFTYNYYDAKEWIKNNFEDIGEVYEELKFQFGVEFLKDYNVFDEPEKFMTLIILESASYLLSQCQFIDDNWNDEIILNKKNIETIKNQLNLLNNNKNIYNEV